MSRYFCLGPALTAWGGLAVAQDRTPRRCRIGGTVGLPVAVSESLAVPSSLAVTTSSPSALKLACLTRPSWRRGETSARRGPASL